MSAQLLERSESGSPILYAAELMTTRAEISFKLRRNVMFNRSSRLRRAAAILLMVALVFPLYNAVHAQNKVEITFWKHSHPPADDLTKTIIDEYMAKNPNVSIKMEIIPSSEW